MKAALVIFGMIIFTACNNQAGDKKGLEADSLKNDPQTGQPIIIPADSTLEGDTTK
jgi:hypothetical protein